jgi:anti-anti-sigma factor
VGELSAHGGASLTYELGENSDGSPLLKLAGELDMTNADALEAVLDPVLARAPSRLVVDVSGLLFGDSSAIALFVKWANLVGQVELREPPELLRRVIARMGLADRLRITP